MNKIVKKVFVIAFCAALLPAALYCTNPDFDNPFDSKSSNYAPYTLIVECDSMCESVSKIPDKPYYRHGETVTITVVPDSGYKFDVWTAVVDSLPSDINTADSTITFAISGNTHIRANFTEAIMPETCDEEYDDATYTCIDGTVYIYCDEVVDRTGDFICVFRNDGTIHAYCGDVEYNPDEGYCDSRAGVVLFEKCGDNFYNPDEMWCVDGQMGKWQQCGNGVRVLESPELFKRCHYPANGIPSVPVWEFTDDRDGAKYEYVKIDNQFWMAQNLNYLPAGFREEELCYYRRTSWCDEYGKLYDWATAMGLSDNCNHEICTGPINSPNRSDICPSGWHLPSSAEWNELIEFVGLDSAGIKLRAETFYGTDVYGFSALGGGMRDHNNNGFSDDDNTGYYWTATERDNSNVFRLSINQSLSHLTLLPLEHDPGGYDGNWSLKTYGYSVRCVRD